jgi:hypothetical protein
MNIDNGGPTDTWTVTNKAGQEIARVDGETIDDARGAAKSLASVIESSGRDGGFSLRRLRSGEL